MTAVISNVVILAQALRRSITLVDPDASVFRLMKRKGYDAKRAEWELHGFAYLAWLPLIAFVTAIFLNGVFGWFPFHIRASD